MARQKKRQGGGGFQESAGLIRYFDEEESTIQVDPRIVVGIGVVLSAVTWMMTTYFPP